jgi:hypothetical protein
MPKRFIRSNFGAGDGPHRHRMTLLFMSLVMLFVALSAGSAMASAPVGGSPAAPQTSVVATTPVLNLSTSELAPILSSVPIADLGLNEAELGELLSELSPGLGSSAGGLTGVVSSLLTPNSSATLGELVTSLSNQSGVLGALLKTLLPGLSPNEIVEALNPAQLNELLGNLTGGEPAGSLTSEDLSQLLSSLKSKLSGEQLETAESILSGLAGVSLSPTTVGTLAEQAGMTSEALAEEVGTNAEQLPAAAPALQGALGSEGPVLGVVKGASGLAVALLPKALKGTEGAEGGNGGGENGGNGNNGNNGENGRGGLIGGGSVNGGPGANGGSGANGAPGGAGAGTTSLLTVPSAGAPPRPTAAKKLAKVRIVSHRVKGTVATIVLQVPAAGRLTLSGKGVSSSAHNAAGAKRLTLKVTLNRAGTASLRRRHNRLPVRLTVHYKSTSGQSSSATATVRFR